MSNLIMKGQEHQTIKWKESWHDEFLEWICGYANAYGNTLYIGKMTMAMLLELAIKKGRHSQRCSGRKTKNHWIKIAYCVRAGRGKIKVC